MYKILKLGIKVDIRYFNGAHKFKLKIQNLLFTEELIQNKE